MYNKTMQPAVISFSLYFLGVLLVGFFVARISSRDLDHYFLANRMLGGFVVALSTVSSGRSAWLLLGFSGMAFTLGISAVWATVGYITVEGLLFLTAGKRLRHDTEMNRDITIPDYFASRFPSHAISLRIISVVLIVFFLTTYVSAQLLAAGKALHSSFELPVSHGILLAAGIILVYTILGGFLAVAITDVIQGLFMIAGLLVLPVYILFINGGFSWLARELTRIQPDLLSPMNITLGGLIGFLGIGLGSIGNPHILVRFMSVKTEQDLNGAAVIATLTNILMAVGATLTGLVGRAVFTTASVLPAGDRENVFPFLAEHALHPAAYGLILAAIFAAIMSTCDSQLLVAASAVVRDFYQKILCRSRDLAEKHLVLLSRVTVLVLVILAILLGIAARQFVFWFVLFSWSGLGAAFGPAILFSLYSRRKAPVALMVGMITGAAVTIIWNQIPFLKSIVYELVPAFFLSTAVILIVSRFEPPGESPEEPEPYIWK